MKNVILAVPATLLLAAGAIAQTDTTAIEGTVGATTEATTDGTAEFGTNWPLSIGTTFFTDAESATLRSSDELAKGWQSLSVEDQAMIRADCQAFLAAHGDAATDPSTGTGGDATTSGTVSTDTSTDTTAGGGATTGSASTDTTVSGTASTDAAASTGTDPATSSPAGYDMVEMKAICEAVGSL